MSKAYVSPLCHERSSGLVPFDLSPGTAARTLKSAFDPPMLIE
jgi:hypothetical protein